jgi:hypothetical protein
MRAIFHKDFNYSSRTKNAGWSVKASKKAQTYPRELIDAAVAVGVAEIVEAKPKTSDTAPSEAE